VLVAVQHERVLHSSPMTLRRTAEVVVRELAGGRALDRGQVIEIGPRSGLRVQGTSRLLASRR
jgi:hypothetical protein